VKHRFAVIVILSTLSAALLGGCKPAQSGESGAAHADPEPTSVTVFGERALLFLEYPHLVRGVEARFLAHLSVLVDGEPVRTGEVTLRIGSVALVAQVPKREGLFVPTGSLPAAGRFPGTLLVRSGQVEETLDLGEIVVHETAAETLKAATSGGEEDPPNAAPFLMEQQWKVKLLLAQAAPRTLIERLSVPAQIVTPQGSEAVVSPPAAGRFLAPVSGELPRVGDRVSAGQVLGFVEPPLAASDMAQLRALDLQYQSLDLEIDLKALEVSRALHEARARLAFAEKENTRIANLRAEGLSTVQQQDEAQQNLAVAKADEFASRSTRESLERLLASRANKVQDREAKSVRLPLVAPIAGIVVDVGSVVGESVHAADELFRLIDTGSVWIEGRISEFDLPRVPSEPNATLIVPALGDRTLDVRHAAGRMLHIAPLVDAATRTLLIRYEMPNSDGLLKAGMLTTLLLETQTASEVIAIPEDAVVLEQGLPVAYVMLAGELFQKRELELGIQDGGYVEVRSGLRAGERLATRGAYAVKLAALSPASFGPGHAH